MLLCSKPIRFEAAYAFIAKLSELFLVVDGKGFIWQIMGVSPSLLAGVKPIPEDWIPPCELLLRLGESWEPFPWDPCYDTENLNVDLLAASQQYEAVLQNNIGEENVPGGISGL